MNYRRLVTVLAALALAVTATPAAASVAHWGMNERRGHVLHDSAGKPQDGHIGHKVNLNGHSHGFSPVPRHTIVPGRIDVVPDSPRLDPERHRFDVRVSFLWSRNNDNTLVQKGQSGAVGGLFKMKTTATGSQPAGYIYCLFRGSIGDSTVASYSHRRLDDGKWHTVRCLRDRKGTTMFVDGELVAHNNKQPGRISNSWPVSIGGNSNPCPVCEPNYWQGRIGDVTWSVG